MERLRSKDLLDTDLLTKEEILLIIDTAFKFKANKIKSLPLNNEIISLLFFEPSTRTKNSFEIAGKKLGAIVVSMDTTGSSLVKGESALNTVRTLQAMGVNYFVIRHRESGFPYQIAERVSASIINAGDGTRGHPTQALLDAMTMIEARGSIEGKKVVIVGDILHSRVARSNIWLLKKLGADITLVGPPEFLPRDFEKLGVETNYSLDDVIEDTDILMGLRIQRERMEKMHISVEEYIRKYQINRERVNRGKPDLIVLHPGPVNVGIEMTEDILYSEISLVERQVTNGVFIRMAILSLLKETRDGSNAQRYSS
ncbi:aspartate carbamoyltransferase catalytic subunit [bacterium]|nr:aspartate carbamoyltransferase catalytic subunit [bacterium]